MLAVRIGPLTAEDFHLIRCAVLSAAPLTTAEHHWTRGVLRQQRVGQRRQRARPAQPPQGIAAQGLVLPPRRHVTSGAADIGPARLLHRVLEAHAIACAITQHYDRRTRRGQLLHLLDQRAMEVFGQVSLGALTDWPREREGSAFIDPMDHQGDTPAPRDPAIQHPDQCLQGQMTQQELGIRHQIPRIRALVVPDPPIST